MKVLIDTNIVVHGDPTRINDVTDLTEPVAKLIGLLSKARISVYCHPAQRKYDFKRDRDEVRRNVRAKLIKKYTELESPPVPNKLLKTNIGDPEKYSRDWVDNQLIAAVFNNAVNFLITEDRGIHKKAERLGIPGKIYSIADAIGYISTLFKLEPPAPPPAVESVKAHSLYITDPIFDSLKISYGEKDFCDWFVKCQEENRDAYVIRSTGELLSAVVILNEETKDLEHIEGKKLKICTFKVAMPGYYYGELLLKAIFKYAVNGKYDFLYITLKSNDNTLEPLKFLLNEFGFEDQSFEINEGTLTYIKSISPSEDERDKIDAVEFLKKYGPVNFKYNDVRVFITPIRPEFHSLLFPDAESQGQLIKGFHPFGNTIRKAYLSNGVIRTIKPGDLILFYESRRPRVVTTVGVVEDTLVSTSPDEILDFVGRRSVYSVEDVEGMCKGEVLTVLFQHVGSFVNPLPYGQLERNGVLEGPPQSIQTIKLTSRESKQWLQKQLTENLHY